MTRKSKSPVKRVSVRDSALFRVRSFRRLSKLLQCEESLLRHLASKDDNYMEFDIKTGRWIEDPKPALKKIHSRFAKLLAQIETPDYLHSAVKGSSYITNAAKHTAFSPSVKIDLKKFYISARSAEVFRFLTDVLEWERDVAGLTVKLLCCRGHLPTGGNASPILSFWAYKPLFDEVNQIALDAECEFSLYVDDMTITGSLACRRLMHRVRSVVGQHRQRAHKLHFFPRGQAKVITGVAQTVAGPRLPHKRHMKIRALNQEYRAAVTDAKRLVILQALIGRLCEAVEVDRQTWQQPAAMAIRERRKLNNRLMRRGVTTAPAADVIVGDHGAAQPWHE